MEERSLSYPEGINFLGQDYDREENPSTFTLLSHLLQSPQAAFFILTRLKGNLRALSLSGIEELQQIPFVGQTRALQLKAAIQLASRIHEYCPEEKVIYSSFDVYALCGRSMEHLDKEHLKIVLLNVKQTFLKIITVAMGGIHSLPVQPREIFRPAVAHYACTSIVLVHNHPTGDPQPSPEDIEAISRLVRAGRILGIRIHDSMIIGHNDYFSFKDEGLIR